MMLGSLFDGIGGFPLAGMRNGFTPLWASEIETFPIQVTKARFPAMLHVGDITKLNGANLEPVDVVSGGSPCQDLSVAGKRAGLAGARSGLYMEQIRVIKEMRDADKLRNFNAGVTEGGGGGNANVKSGGAQHGVCGADGLRPRFMLWENVPGAFSSNGGEDFRAVLEEAARIADETVAIPRPAKGKWNTAGAIMGDGWSLAWRVLDAQHWGVPQRRRRIFLVADFGGQSAPEILFKREGLRRYSAESGEAREGAAGGAAGSVRAAGECLTPLDVQSRRIYPAAGTWPALYAGEGGGRGYVWPDVSATLPRRMDGSPYIDRGPQVVAVQTAHTGANGSGYSENGPAYTLDGANGQAVCYDMTHACDVIRDCGDTVPTIQNRMGTGGNQVPLVMAHGQAIVASVNCRNFNETPMHGTLQAKENGGQSLNYMGAVRTGHAVRRLTPLECERLQGFPDGWTDVAMTVRKKYKSGKKMGLPLPPKQIRASDSARYKVLGNSVAIPCVEYVMEGIAEVLRKEAAHD